ncbi:MAG: methyltransferase domain-containing protein [Candidatus Moranbacteria bacterium]|nr:methyltransferase domain-containing protein [Candidatus Moranbacteria bacterium]
MSIFFSSNRDQKKFVRKKLAQYYPNFKSGGYFYKKFIKNLIHKDSIILDAGCGEKGLIESFNGQAKLIIGVDVDKKELRKNKIAQKKIAADLKAIPLKNNSLDLVVCEFVLEHLNNPKPVIKEIFRVLKPGGGFVFITPNVVNPIMFLSKISPHRLHEFLLKNLLKKPTRAHRTYYKANTLTRLKILAKIGGFERLKIVRAGNSEYLGFCKPLVIPSIFLEKLMVHRPLTIFQMYLVGCFVKRLRTN